MALKSSAVDKFFIFCSGADTNWLRQCPQKEATRYFSIGSLVFMTGIFATVSSSFAFYSLLHPIPLEGNSTTNLSDLFLPVCLGIVWGIFIFFLDRAFVSTMSKNISPLKQILGAIPRYALAILLSISISKPLEIYLFKQRIVQQINDEYRKSIADKTRQERKNLNDKEQQDSVTKSQINKNLNISLTPSDKENLLTDQLKKLNEEITNEQANVNAVNKPLSNQLAGFRGTPEEYRALVKSINVQKAANGRHLNELKTERKNAQDELNKSIKDRTEQSKRTGEKLTISQHADSNNLNAAKNELENQVSLVKKIDSSAHLDVFVNQLLALQNLIDAPALPTDSALQASEKKNFWWMHFVIWMIFLVIEIAPVTMKLILPKGEYDALANAGLEKIRDRMEEKRISEKVVNKYYYDGMAKSEMKIMQEYFDKIKPEREATLNSLIENWKAGTISFSELAAAVAKKIFNIPALSENNTPAGRKTGMLVSPAWMKALLVTATILLLAVSGYLLWPKQKEISQSDTTPKKADSLSIPPVKLDQPIVITPVKEEAPAPEPPEPAPVVDKVKKKPFKKTNSDTAVKKMVPPVAAPPVAVSPAAVTKPARKTKPVIKVADKKNTGDSAKSKAPVTGKAPGKKPKKLPNVKIGKVVPAKINTTITRNGIRIPAEDDFAQNINTIAVQRTSVKPINKGKITGYLRDADETLLEIQNNPNMPDREKKQKYKEIIDSYSQANDAAPDPSIAIHLISVIERNYALIRDQDLLTALDIIIEHIRSTNVNVERLCPMMIQNKWKRISAEKIANYKSVLGCQ